MYRLSFDYLGLEKPESLGDNFSDFMDISSDFPGHDRSDAGIIKSDLGILPYLRDTNQSESHTLELISSNSFHFHLLLEDFFFSGNVPINVYSDNILLEAIMPDFPSVPVSSSVWVLFAFVTMGVDSKIKSQLSKTLPNFSGENGFNISRSLL